MESKWQVIEVLEILLRAGNVIITMNMKLFVVSVKFLIPVQKMCEKNE